MGKIFGISDLPVSTIMTPFEPIYVINENHSREKRKTDKTTARLGIAGNRSVQKESTRAKTQTFINMRNGIGKLMKHFSKKAVK